MSASETTPSPSPSDAPSQGSKRRTNDRRCVGAGTALGAADEGLRFVLDPTGALVLDLKGTLPGRGAWVSPDRSALEAALSRGGFQRGFKGPAKLPAGMDQAQFIDHVTERLAAAALSRLGLCRKAGTLAIGHDAVRKSASKAICYLTPNDASAPEVDKLGRFLAKSVAAPHLPLPIDRVALSSALDQDAVHLALLRGGPSAGALGAVKLWQRFSGDSRG